MDRIEKENWYINLEDVSDRVDAGIVEFVCNKYGSKDIYHLHTSDLSTVYNELYEYAVEAEE